MATVDLTDVALEHGAHDSRQKGVCAMEASAWLDGIAFDKCEKCEGRGFNGSACEACGGWGIVAREITAETAHTDQPACVSPVLGAVMRSLNDNLDAEGRQRLKPYTWRVLGTAGDGKDEQRGWLAADWAVRQAAPTWLELAGVTEAAAELRALAPLEKGIPREVRERLWALRDEMWKLRSEKRQQLREKVKAAVKDEFEKRGLTKGADADADAAAAAAAAADAAAAAAADADAAAAAAAAAAAVADAGDYYATYDAVYKAVKPKVQEVYDEKFADLNQSFKGASFELLERLIDPAAEQVAA